MERLLLGVLLAAICLGAGSAQTATPQEPADRTLSPYFFVKSDDPDVDRLPLASSSASVDIAGVIASVRLTQVYKNAGRRALEAIYVFPGSTRAAVHGMTMTIGERRIVARIQERQEARRQYEAAREAGQTASLLEQQRPNVFQMNVANILPGDQIKVELFYTELLVPRDQVYEFVFPTVVGPRYTNGLNGGAAGNEGFTRNPYLRQGEPPASTFDFRASIAAGMPLKEVGSPSHEVDVDYVDQQRAHVSLRPSDRAAGNRDVVLRYRLADDRIEAGVLLGASGDERFFLCLVEPPRRFAESAVPPREYIFIMDVSGSMNGFPIETSKELLSGVLNRLRPIDAFNVLFFAGASYVLSPASLQATDVNKARAIREVDHQQGGGGTELLPALVRALGLPRSRPGISRTVVIATDGYVDVERDALTLVRDHLGDANVFAFGIGSSVNRHLIEGMARVGEGEPFIVLNPGEAPAAASRFLDYIRSPLLTGIEVRTPGLQAYDLEPARTPDLFAQRPLVIAGKYRGEAAGEIVVTGVTGEGRFERRIPVRGRPITPGDALKYLWARERVAVLSDFRLARGGADDETRRQITDLGLKYSLLTEFTSFVAIDQRIRRSDGTYETVKQPLPLPEGVSDRAVGGQPGVVAESVALRATVAGGVAATSKAAGWTGNTAAPSAAPVQQAGTDSRRDRMELTSLPRVTIVESRLAGRDAAAPRTLEQRIAAALASADRAVGGALARGERNVRLTFGATGLVTKVELLGALKPSDPADLAQRIQQALQKGAVSAGAGGHVTVTVGSIR